jgi:hypothetical protein
MVEKRNAYIILVAKPEGKTTRVVWTGLIQLRMRTSGELL